MQSVETIVTVVIIDINGIMRTFSIVTVVIIHTILTVVTIHTIVTVVTIHTIVTVVTIHTIVTWILGYLEWLRSS